MSTAYTCLNGINISAEIAVFISMGVLPLSLWGQGVELEVGREKYKIQSETTFKLDLLNLSKVGYFEVRSYIKEMIEASAHVVLKIAWKTAWKTHSRYSPILSTE